MKKVYIVEYYNAGLNKKDRIAFNKVFDSYDKAARYLMSAGLIFTKTSNPYYERWSFPKNSFSPAYIIREFKVEE